MTARIDHATEPLGVLDMIAALKAAMKDAERRREGAGLTARYPGECANCGERIHEGDPIRMTESGAVHADCPEHEPRPVIEGEACPACWLRHPEGACDRD